MLWATEIEFSHPVRSCCYAWSCKGCSRCLLVSDVRGIHQIVSSLDLSLFPSAIFEKSDLKAGLKWMLLCLEIVKAST